MTISNLTISTIKSNHAVLQDKAFEITATMHEILLGNAPELKNLFSSNSYPAIMAHTLTAYSKHIDDINALKPLLNRIAEKYAAADIKIEYYLLVIDALINAMEVVLGDEIFNDELKKAWTEAYYNFAAVLILMKRKPRS
ncbi:hypothetical protein MNBD_GAMMA03-1687 [hydrothermal vent metagenome]|uniref:Globin domain-containing protein n=1 Tax=hydrothermal vent metagenome TaxID=652676 RepID=A0A3B0VRQ6_9ZZZZ